MVVPGSVEANQNSERGLRRVLARALLIRGRDRHAAELVALAEIAASEAARELAQVMGEHVAGGAVALSGHESGHVTREPVRAGLDARRGAVAEAKPRCKAL